MRNITLVKFDELLGNRLPSSLDIFYSKIPGDYVIFNADEMSCPIEGLDWSKSVAAESGPDLASLFQERAAVEGAKLTLVYLQNAIVYPRQGLVITNDGKLVEETCSAYFSENMSLLNRLNSLPHLKYTGEGITCDEFIPVSFGSKALLASHAGSKVFGHWYFDSLPVVVAAREGMLCSNSTMIVDDLTSWQRETLDLVGASGLVTEVGDAPIRVAELILSSYVGVANTRRSSVLLNAVFSEMREHVETNAKNTKSAGKAKLLYITRRNVRSRRRMINEEELCEQLSSVGFKIIAPEELSVEDQILSFKKADLVLAPAGSANVNVGFMKAGSRFIEIFSGEYYDFAFCRLALNAGLKYSYFQSPTMAEDFGLYAWHGFQPGHQYFSYDVDIPNLLNMLVELGAIETLEGVAPSLGNGRLSIKDVEDQRVFFRISETYRRLSLIERGQHYSTNDRDIYLAVNEGEESILVHPKPQIEGGCSYTRAEYGCSSDQDFVWAGATIWSPHPKAKASRFSIRVRDANSRELLAEAHKILSGGEISFLGTRLLEQRPSVCVELETVMVDPAGGADYAWCKFVKPSLFQ